MLQVSAVRRSYCRLWLRLYLNHTEINMCVSIHKDAYAYIHTYNVFVEVFFVSFRRHHRFLAAFKKAKNTFAAAAAAQSNK